MSPSTLNLYAVYLLSQATSLSNLPQQPVTLPNNIPYAMVSEAELNSVTSPAIQNSTTSLMLTQTVSTATYGPWPIIGIIVGGAVVVLALRARKTGGRKGTRKEPEVILRDSQAVQDTRIQADQAKKKCGHCGTMIPREDLICRKCGMPAVYLGAHTPPTARGESE
jgi:hypothetical protein